MNSEEYRFLFELEERHWWFVGMRKITAALLDPLLPSGPRRILDAGCGTGFMLGWLRQYCEGRDLYGLDFSAEALNYCAQRGEHLLLRGSVEDLPFPDRAFDVVISLNVLEYFALPEAQRAISEMTRVLKEGGLIFVRTSAFQYLYSEHDRAISGVHRYTVTEVKQCLLRQGLELERLTYANTLLFPVAMVWRWLRRPGRRPPQSDVRPLPRGLRWANVWLARILTLEAAWFRHFRCPLPAGLSVIGIARKSGGSHQCL